MSNYLKIFTFPILFLLLSGCNNSDSSNSSEATGAKSIATKDVKGELDLMGASGNDLSYSYNGTSFEAYKIKIGKTAEFIIYPTDKSFEETKTAIEKKTKSSFDKGEIIKVDKDCIFYKESKVPFGKSDEKEGEKIAKEGYAFVRVIKKNDTQNYILKSNGDTPLDPIWDQEAAEKLLAIAKTFKAKD